MKKLETVVRGLLLQDGYREAGEAVIDGKTVTWEAGFIVALLSLYDEKGKTRKYPVDPKYVPAIEAQLAEISWGSVIELDMSGKFVTGVTVLLDWLDNLPIG